MKDTEDLNKWRDIPWSWIERFYNKDVILQKLTYRLYCNYYQNPSKIIYRHMQDYSKIMWNHKGTLIDKTILKKEKVGANCLPDFKMYYLATVIKTIILVER
jgi:hypothetical protein